MADSESTQKAASGLPPTDDPFEGVRWSTLDRQGFAELYREELAPRFEADGHDAEMEKPTHQWFRDEGLRAFLAALRRHHDCSFGEFWDADLCGDSQDRGYDWATDDEATVEVLERFLDRRRNRHDLSDSSIDAMRTRLNLYVRAYTAANDTDDLLSPVRRDSERPAYEAVDACYAAFDWLNDEGYAARTKRRVRGVVDDWYQHLVGRRVAATNPATGLYAEFKWQIDATDPPALTADHVRSLMMAADGRRERLLVVALAGWGLRANEVASLHVSQVHRDDDVPYLTFEERKNGPGEVNLLYGVDALDDRIDELSAASGVDSGDSGDDWHGYLFPSSYEGVEHVGRERIWAWFRDLAERADLPETVGDEHPSPQLCRRFWYDTYTAALGEFLEGVGDIAAEQGSSDPAVVHDNYLSDERARRTRREFMRSRLAEAFEG
ncbi:tyrosine-type recombinase/integrase [Halomarina salina]|uniref:Tyrosine-type recombinase/integrase n=1 Tax=Halomarina salina TaxID=1872699 RepID=A0ABD5RT94_9EURY|nr:tyrosine-type recombinase/integrase [Halomarina salina]